MENMNPGGTGKDRAAQRMIDEAEKSGLLKPGGDVVEGTSGRSADNIFQFELSSVQALLWLLSASLVDINCMS